MGYIQGGKDVSQYVAGWSTFGTWNDLSTSVVNAHYKLGDVALRAVPRHKNFMPFSQFEVPGFLANKKLIIDSGDWAGVNRFILKPVIRISKYFSNAAFKTTLKYYYKGGGGYHSFGTLYDDNGLEAECPPVIMVYFQAAGGNGGGSRRDGVWIGQQWCAGGGGGSGAFFAGYVELPYNTDGEKTLIMSINQSNGNFDIAWRDSSVNVSVSRGKDGGTPAANQYAGGSAGSRGTVSWYSLPSYVKLCCFTEDTGSFTPNISEIYGASGGVGGYANGPAGANAVYTMGKDGNAVSQFRYYVDGVGTTVPIGRTINYSGGSRGDRGGGGGGASSRMGRGGSGGKGSSGYDSDYAGGRGNIGAGGGGGSCGGNGFATINNGGKGGDSFFAICW